MRNATQKRRESLAFFIYLFISLLTDEQIAAGPREPQRAVRQRENGKIGIIYTEKCKWNCNRLSAEIAMNISTEVNEFGFGPNANNKNETHTHARNNANIPKWNGKKEVEWPATRCVRLSVSKPNMVKRVNEKKKEREGAQKHSLVTHASARCLDIACDDNVYRA